MKSTIPNPTLKRLPIYYRRLKIALAQEISYVSSNELGKSAGVPAAQVRKDLSYLAEKGRPGVGYDAEALADQLESFLGLAREKEALLVGVGNLGRALVLYPGFKTYGLEISLLFDNDPAKIGQEIHGREILPVDELTETARRRSIMVGIITVPAAAAQAAARAMLDGGVKAIWNFAPQRLNVPDDVYVKNEDLAAGLAVLAHHVHQIENSD
jgi:redox-sensing transcriptional repressor